LGGGGIGKFPESDFRYLNDLTNFFAVFNDFKNASSSHINFSGIFEKEKNLVLLQKHFRSYSKSKLELGSKKIELW